MNYFISFVRIFYTVNLLFLGLGLLLWYNVSHVASQHGHNSFDVFAPQNLVIFALYFLLFISRLLVSRSLNWLWLGTPTILAVYGFALFIFLTTPR